MSAPHPYAELSRELHDGVSPYAFADSFWLDDKYPHTFLPEELIVQILTHVKTDFWVEVGSMVGGSAIKTARTIWRDFTQRDTGISLPSVVCIDPFTADVGAWFHHGPDRGKEGAWDCLRLQGARPRIYERFLANVQAAKVEDIVLPLVMTSAVGLRLLKKMHEAKRLSSLPGVVYLDGSHEEGETYLELVRAWDLLPEGGVLFGDDWDWPGVRLDVQRFVRDEVTRNVHKGLERREKVLSIVKPLTSEPLPQIGLGLYKNHWILCK